MVVKPSTKRPSAGRASGKAYRNGASAKAKPAAGNKKAAANGRKRANGAGARASLGKASAGHSSREPVVQLQSEFALLVKKHKYDFLAALFLVAGILCSMAIYFKSVSTFGNNLESVSGSLLGAGRFIMPSVFILLGIILISLNNKSDEDAESDSKTVETKSRSHSYAVLAGSFLIGVSILGLFHLSLGRPDFTEGLQEEFKSAGGVLGAIFAIPLETIFGVAFAGIVLGAIGITGLSIATKSNFKILLAYLVRPFASNNRRNQPPTPDAFAAAPGIEIFGADSANLDSANLGQDLNQKGSGISSPQTAPRKSLVQKIGNWRVRHRKPVNTELDPILANGTAVEGILIPDAASHIQNQGSRDETAVLGQKALEQKALEQEIPEQEALKQEALEQEALKEQPQESKEQAIPDEQVVSGEQVIAGDIPPQTHHLETHHLESAEPQDVVEPDVVVEPEVIKPGAVEPGAVEPDVVEPNTIEPDAEAENKTISEPTKPESGRIKPESGPTKPEAEPNNAAGSTPNTGSLIPATEKKINWMLPPLKLLSKSTKKPVKAGPLKERGQVLEQALAAHGVITRVIGRVVGPTVTRYELELGEGIKVAKLTSLNKDIAYAMAAHDVRILAPIPGRQAIGIEVPNMDREIVLLGDMLSSSEALSSSHPLVVPLGRDINGETITLNIAETPHLLIAGATGAGKSSSLNSIVTSILMRSTPEQVRLILIDPKMVEMCQFENAPHLLSDPVVDPKKAANALGWATREMDRRYNTLFRAGYRDITGYNAAYIKGELAGKSRTLKDKAQNNKDAESPEFEYMPFIVVVVDELADLMMVAAKDVEDYICRLAQKARAVGIHLVIATQRPSTDVITGVIKANVPARLAFSVSSLTDSRVILDQAGAERLVGQGDMLLRMPTSGSLIRIQGSWITEKEVKEIVKFWRAQEPQTNYIDDLTADTHANSARISGDSGDSGDDELLELAQELVVNSGFGSTSMLQRKLRVGFARAGRLMDLLEERGIVGPSEGSKPREVLILPNDSSAE